METGKMPYHLGCTGWSLSEWVGTFFKERSKAESFLAQYASVFNSVEGNTTFYRTPDKATIEQWGEKVPAGFKFCFKFPKLITHIRRLNEANEDILEFLDVFEPIRDKCGPFMIQFPDTFSPRELNTLEGMLSVLPKTMSYGVEVRHPDFFDQGRHEHALNTLLKSYAVDRIIFDTRKLHATRSADATIRTAQQKKPKVPVRFNVLGTRPILRYVGTNDVLNNEAYLKEWAIIVADWIKEGLHPYVFIHSPDRVSQPKLCTHFHHLLSELIPLKPLPDWPIDREKQLGLF